MSTSDEHETEATQVAPTLAASEPLQTDDSAGLAATATDTEEITPEIAAEDPPHATQRIRPPLAERFATLFFEPMPPVPADRLPHKAEPLELPDSAVEDIYDLLTASFFAQAGIQLAKRAPEELPRFVAEAERVRNELQDRDAAVVELNGLLGNQFLQCVILRETVLMLQDLRAANASIGRESALACSCLPENYSLIADAPRQRLLLIRHDQGENRYWQLSLSLMDGFKAVRDVTWLPDLHFLVADAQSRQVAEIALDGEVPWRFDTAHSPEHALRTPVRATRFADAEGRPRYLLADQSNHHVLDVDAGQRINWQYGVMGQSRDLDGYLNSPSDVQFTPQRSYLVSDSGNHRVLEIQQRKLIRNLGESDGLDRPIYAERFEDGSLLIVDELRHSVFEFDARNQRKSECQFFKTGMDDRLRTGKGLKVYRRANRNLLLCDGEKLFELDYRQQKILWFTQLRNLHTLLSRPLELINPDEARIESKAYETYDNGPPPTEMVTLRQMLANVPLFAAEKTPTFFEEVEKLLKYHEFHPNTLIVEKGKPLKSMFLIQSGVVEVFSEKAGEPVTDMSAGESFGMMGIVYVEPRQADIRAKTHCGVFELEKKHFDRLVENYPEIEAQITRLASERLAVARIKQGQTEEKTKARFQEVLAMQKARFASAHAKVSETRPSSGEPAAPAIKAKLARPGFRPRRITYSDAQKQLIHEALDQGQQCLEVHIFLHLTSMMKGARAFLLIMVLERLGQIIHSTPTLEDIKAEKSTGAEVIITLATQHARDQVLEDAASVAEVDRVEVLALDREAETTA